MCLCSGTSEKKRVTNNTNESEQQRLDYLSNLRQQIRSVYTVEEFYKIINENKEKYSQQNELEEWVEELVASQKLIVQK
jgi:hypothetical protein